MSGKISGGVRSAARGPRIRSSSASTKNVYGRLRAMRTIAVIEQAFLHQSHGSRGNSRADLAEMQQNGQPGRPPRLQFRETGPKVRPARLTSEADQRISSRASAKNSGPPKLPDFRASSISPFF